MRADQLTIAQDSYARCCNAPGFFDAFYRNLLGSSPDIPQMFAKTDFERQHKLLQHSLGVLLIYAKRHNPALLERVATRHSRKDMNVDPSLYPFFVESLIAAVRECDPESSAEVEKAWRVAMEPGIEFMKGKY
jgi:hemoglobin-like flavoprotein